MAKGHLAAQVHTHFNIFANQTDEAGGAITLEEQIKAVERFVRWHERQVKVGTDLMLRLRLAQALAANDGDAVVAVVVGGTGDLHD